MPRQKTAPAPAVAATLAGPIAYGYARVSTDRQDTGSDAQRRALEAAGCTAIVEEQASGRKARPALAALVDQLAPGDSITVCRFDRVARNVPSFYAIGEQIAAKGATLRSLAEQFDTSTPIGRAMMGFAAVWAELESDVIRERTNVGMRAARARGQVIGRRTTLSPEVEREIAVAIAGGEEHKPLARKHRVSPRTIRRIKQRYAQQALPLALA